MFPALSDWFRLFGAAFRLTRHDALVPKEYAHLAPEPVRWFGALTRIGATTKKDGRALRPGERLAAAFETMSPPYVKLGQMMATRPDIIGFEMAGDLGRLQDRMPAFSDDAARAEIERTFGQPVDALFAELSPPVAAASIAQVHKAVLKDDPAGRKGRTLAIKILRPHIEQRAVREFRAFMRAARLAERVSTRARRLEPVEFIETLRASAAIELDLRMEAGAASTMKDLLKDDPQTVIPEIYWPLTAKRVLAIDWIDATPINDLDALDRQGVDRKALAIAVMRLFLRQALNDGFFHADMHQGNLMIDKAGRIVLIDFGIMGRLDEAARETFAQIIHGFIARDYKRTARAHFDAGYIGREHSVDVFAQALRAVGEPLYGQTADKVDMSRVLQQLFDVTDLFDMHLRPELVLLQRTMVTVEGVARALDPSIDMWDAATPVVRKYIEDNIGPRRQLERLRVATEKAIELAPHLPAYLDRLTDIAHAANPDAGVDRPSSRRQPQRAGPSLAGSGLWLIGLGLLAIAGAIIVG